jgi:hypothetical protein
MPNLVAVALHLTHNVVTAVAPFINNMVDLKRAIAVGLFVLRPLRQHSCLPL